MRVFLHFAPIQSAIYERSIHHFCFESSAPIKRFDSKRFVVASDLLDRHHGNCIPLHAYVQLIRAKLIGVHNFSANCLLIIVFSKFLSF